MADFVQKTVNKTAIRDLAVPIADVTSFNTFFRSVIDDNPSGCVGYADAGGEAVVRNREHYTAKVDFIDGEGKRVGTVSRQPPDDRRRRDGGDILCPIAAEIVVRRSEGATFFRFGIQSGNVFPVDRPSRSYVVAGETSSEWHHGTYPGPACSAGNR